MTLSLIHTPFSFQAKLSLGGRLLGTKGHLVDYSCTCASAPLANLNLKCYIPYYTHKYCSSFSLTITMHYCFCFAPYLIFHHSRFIYNSPSTNTMVRPWDNIATNESKQEKKQNCFVIPITLEATTRQRDVKSCSNLESHTIQVCYFISQSKLGK